MNLQSRDNAAAWALVVQGLDDASEHLADLAKQLASDPNYGEEELRVDLGHVFAHLNRAWNSRHIARDLSDAEWESPRRFPDDLEPIA